MAFLPTQSKVKLFIERLSQLLFFVALVVHENLKLCNTGGMVLMRDNRIIRKKLF
jgi:hypothetical protein